MAKFVIVLAIALQLACGAPQNAKKTELEQLASQVQGVANTISETLQKNLPDTKEVTQTITTQSQQFAQNVEDIVKKFKTEIENSKGKRDEVLRQISGKVSEAVASIQQLSGPDANKKANEIRTQLENNVKTVAAEFEKLGKSVEPNLQQAGDTVSTFAKGVLDDFLKAAQTFQNQVRTAVEKN